MVVKVVEMIFFSFSNLDMNVDAHGTDNYEIVSTLFITAIP